MKISPSILACDFSKLGEEIKLLELADADYIHLDIMDGLFVKNITFGTPIIKAIRGFTKIPFDVHLMIKEPHRYIKEFSESGADIITFHLEAETNIKNTIDLIKSYGKKVGIAIKPGTNIERVYEYLKYIDLVLIMTVEPGFGGQSFIINMMEKVKKIKEESKKQEANILIEVDGGINEETAKIAKFYGVDICVAGTSIFKSDDIKKVIKKLK